jgi:acetylornithine deacetylase/succinyl-diaminopimelate desuccinylase-like protein
MDVVPAKAEECAAVSAQIRRFLHGRGTLDTKGLGSPTGAPRCAPRRPGSCGKLFLVANADEEVGGGKGEYFVRNLPFPIGGVRDERGRRGVTDIRRRGKFFR